MKKFLSRCAVLIPLVFSLLLAVVPISSAFADSDFTDIETDYTLFDFSHYNITPTNSNSYTKEYTRSLLPYTYSNYPYYFYCVYCFNSQGYTNICVNYVSFYSLATESSTGAIFNSAYFSYAVFRYDKTPSSSWFTNLPTDAFRYFGYGKTNGYFRYLDTTDTDCVWSTSNMEDFSIIYQESNYPDFPYADDIIHNADNTPHVSVSFSPSLSGNVNREINNNGSISYLSNLNMTVSNSSSFPVQYKMYIMKTEQTTHRPYNFDSSAGTEGISSSWHTKYDDDPVFIYYSDEWVYSTNLDYSDQYYNGQPQKQNKSTEWHYLSAGSSSTVNFKFSQINLQEGCSYTCYVEAIKCPYDCASRMFVSLATSEAAYPEYKQLLTDDKVLVYQSSFTMLQYSDVKYDPSDKSNGINPFSDYADLQGYNLSYNAIQDSNGNVDYSSKNVVTDKNSWWYTRSQNLSYNTVSDSGSFGSITNYTTNFLSFISSVLGFFPQTFLSVFTVGMTSLVVVGLIKVVFR